MSETEKYRLIDLFAGIGGIRLGFEQTKRVDVVFSSEIDKYAAQTYQANFDDTPSGDITRIETKDIPQHDILVGGFPCQAFSLAGKRMGFADIRGTLFFEIARILKDKRPKAFLLENVKGLLSHDKGNTFEVIKTTIDELGYDLKFKVLSGKDFGVPQNRQRIFLVGIRKDLLKNGDNPFEFPQNSGVETRVGDILESNPDALNIP